jgi:peptide/nickel transport system substrate-binding protein
VNRRDQAVAAFLVVVLVVLGGVLALPRQRDAGNGGDDASPSAEPTAQLPLVFREGVIGSVSSITPVTARTRAERDLVGLVFSGLVKLGPEDTYQPDLASSWTTDTSGKVWTFTIRDDAVWSDGSPVVAEDVVYTVSALKSPDVQGSAAGAWADVSVEAVDEVTVRLTLGTPIGGVLALATQPLLPSHLLADTAFADIAASEYATLPVGSGAFSITDVDATGATLVPVSQVVAPVEEDPSADPSALPTGDSLFTPWPRPSVTVQRANLDELRVRFYPDETALTAALRAGEVDAASGLSDAALDGLASDATLERHVYPTTTLSAVLLNLRPTHPELRDSRARKALLAAIDRDHLVADVLGGSGDRADTLVPPESWAFDQKSAGSIAFDRKAAAKSLADAGWTKKSGKWFAPSGKSAYKLELLTVPATANPRLASVAAYVRDQWTALGLDVKLDEVKGSELATRLRKGDFAAAVVDIAEGLEPDLYPLLASSQVRSTGTNLAGYQDTALDPLLAAARKPGTEEARATSWKALLSALASRMPMLPLAWNDEVMLARGLEGVTPRLISDTGDRYWDVLAWRLAADR